MAIGGIDAIESCAILVTATRNELASPGYCLSGAAPPCQRHRRSLAWMKCGRGAWSAAGGRDPGEDVGLEPTARNRSNLSRFSIVASPKRGMIEGFGGRDGEVSSRSGWVESSIGNLRSHRPRRGAADCAILRISLPSSEFVRSFDSDPPEMARTEARPRPAADRRGSRRFRAFSSSIMSKRRLRNEP